MMAMRRAYKPRSIRMASQQCSVARHAARLAPVVHRATATVRTYTFIDATHGARCLIRGAHTSASRSSPMSQSAYHAEDLTSDSHTFTAAQFDTIRLLTMLASSASASAWELLAHLVSFVPVGYERYAIEAIMPVQVFSGIPRTIEGAATVRHALEEREAHSHDSAWLSERRKQSHEFIQNTINNPRILKLLERLVALDGSAPLLPPSLSAEQPSHPPLDATYPPVCPHCNDTNSTAIRKHRGRHTLNVVYGSATDKLLAALSRSHPALEQSVHQHIYGHILCTPILSVHSIELISIACLTYQRTVRQLFSHVRGALMNGCTRAMCEVTLDDAESIYRYSDGIASDRKIPWIVDARRLIVKIDRKVNPSHYADDESPASSLTAKL